MHTTEHQGYTFQVEYHYDDNIGPPDKENDGHGEVSNWVTRDKRPGERIIAQDRGQRRFYDWQGAIAIAKRDGWDAPPYQTGTKGERAARAVQADFDYLWGWYNNEWHYVGVVVQMLDDKGDVIAEDSLWGVETYGDYHEQQAQEMIESLYNAHMRELAEREHWATRDVVTV